MGPKITMALRILECFPKRLIFMVVSWSSGIDMKMEYMDQKDKNMGTNSRSSKLTFICETFI